MHELFGEGAQRTGTTRIQRSHFDDGGPNRSATDDIATGGGL